jgi:tellurite resistance protein
MTSETPITRTATAKSSFISLPIVPASAFGIVLGIVGLGGSWRATVALWGLPTLVGECLNLVGFVIWLILLVLYAAKWVFFRDDAVAEVRHPVQCSFVALLGVATMLVAQPLSFHAQAAAFVVYWSGATFTVVYAVWLIGNLWEGDRPRAAITAALYLPAGAGGFVTAIVGGGFGMLTLAQLAFGAGFLTWLAVESALFHRLFTEPELPNELRATMGIQLAPPAVGTAAYLSATIGQPDTLAHAMFGYAVLQALVLLRLTPWLLRQKFGVSYWAFTFGATALATDAIRLVERGDGSPLLFLAPTIFIVVNVTVLIIAVATIFQLAHGSLFGRKRIYLTRSVRQQGDGRPFG